MAAALGADLARDWGTLYDARLVEVVDGTPKVAAELYRELLEDRPPTDPLYAPTALWLGRALLDVDDLEGAAAVLAIAGSNPATRDAAVLLLEETELRRNAVQTLPQTWTFDTGEFPAVRRASGNGRGGVGVRRADAAVVLSWSTSVRPGEPDYLALRLANGLPLREVRLRIRPVEFPAVVRLVVVDADGHQWNSEDFWLGNEDWSELVVPTSTFRRDGPRGEARAPRLVSDLRVEDVSGERSPMRGENTLLLDDVSLR